MTKKRIWWIPQVPIKAFYVEVCTFREAALLLNTLVEYDKFQFGNNIKPDYCNVRGLQVFDPNDHEDDADGSWVDWDAEDLATLDELSEAEIDALDAGEAAEAAKEP